MLAPEDTTLVAADRSQPGLGHVLDLGALLDRTGRALRAAGVDPVGGRVHYLRYKPGTSIVAGLVLETPGAPVRAYAEAHAPAGRAKLDKLADFARRDPVGFGAVIDGDLLLAVAAATSDRDLPGLRTVLTQPRKLLPHDLATGDLDPVRYKPHRRWVGVLHDGDRAAVLVKVHRAGTVRDHVDATRAFGGSGVRVPRPLTWRNRRGLVSYRYLRGRDIDPADAATVSEAGALLAAVHAVPPWRQAPRRDDPLGKRLAEEASAVAVVVPALAARVEALAARVRAGLRELQPPQLTCVHGDFSADQVIRRTDGLALLDLDRSGVGDPADDLATWAAAAVVAAVGAAVPAGRAPAPPEPAVLVAPLTAGYEAAGGQVDPPAAHAHRGRPAGARGRAVPHPGPRLGRRRGGGRRRRRARRRRRRGAPVTAGASSATAGGPGDGGGPRPGAAWVSHSRADARGHGVSRVPG